jgi:AraC-like DNA-binding protein
MFRKFYVPITELQPSIESFVAMHNINSDDPPLNDKFVPRLGAGMVFHFRDTFKLVSYTGSIVLPKVFLVGQQKKFLFIESGKKYDSIIVLFTATGMHRLFQIPADEISKAMQIDAGLILGPTIYSLYDQLADESNINKRVHLLEQFFIHQLISHKTNENDSKVDYVANEIIQSKGHINIASLCRKINIDERSLRRSFLKEVGIGAKSCARIVRISQIMEELEKNSEIDVMSLVCQYNYYDQAHLIKDFKEILGETPISFRNKDKLYMRLISALK